MSGIPGDAEREIEILRTELTKREDQLVLVNKALFETNLKVHIIMRRLLTANDVKGDRAMRVNILEQMNDLKREINAFFSNAGIVIDVHDQRRQP